MEKNKIFNIHTSNINIEKLNEKSGSLLGFFTSKSRKEVIAYIIYKSNMIFGLSDSTLVQYDLLKEKQVLEINELLHKNITELSQMKIIYEVDRINNQDILLCVCGKSLIFMDLDKYQIRSIVELKYNILRIYIQYNDDKYRILVLFKNNISIYNYHNEGKILLDKLYDFDKLETIYNHNILFLKNYLIYESKSKLNVIKFDYNKNIKSLSYNKKELIIYKNDSEAKLNDYLKDLQFNYSYLTDNVYITIYNKLFVIRNTFDDFYNEEFEVIQKITKQNFILYTVVIDPFLFVYLDNKIYVYFVLDMNKCLEIYEKDTPLSHFNFNNNYYNDIIYLLKTNKLNLEDNVIEYNDEFHMSKIRGLKDFEQIINSARYHITIYNNKSNKLLWIISLDYDLICNSLTRINQEFTTKFLSFMIGQNSQINNKNAINKKNQNFLLKKILSIFYYLISIHEFQKAKIFSEDTHIENNYIIILLRNFIYSKNLINLIDNILANENNIFEENSYLKDILTSSLLKNEKELSIFLKTFFNRMIIYRNELKMQIDKQKRKSLEFNAVLENIRYVGIDEIKFCIIENIIFISHFFSYKLSKNLKYTENLKMIIKNSHNILDKELMNMLKDINLEEEILLFYFYKGNFSKCINTIVSIYENITLSDDKIGNELDKELNISTSHIEDEKSIDKIKNQWFCRYINLLSVICDKITPLEFNEYIKWALSKNAFKTIDILFENGKISKEKLDLEFISILKIYGIDPVIYYLKHFIRNNQSDSIIHHNEMINLYTIKLKLLTETMEKEYKENPRNQESFYKWNKKIIKTREEFCNFLIENKLFDLGFALDKINQIPSLKLEYGIILIKQNKLEEGIPLILNSDTNNNLKIIKKIIKIYPSFDLIYLILKNIINGESLEKDKLIIQILEIIKDRFDLIIDILSLEIFKDLKIENFLEYLIHLFGNIDIQQKNYKIESSLTESKIINMYNIQIEFERNKILIDNKSCCHKCKNGFINNMELVYIYPKIVFHHECYNDYLFDNN